MFEALNHPDLDDSTYIDDIAVFELAAYSKYPPIRLLTPDLVTLSAPTTTVTAVGWGRMVSAL